MKTWLIVALALVCATPAAGQEWLVNRDQFTYLGSRLTIEVTAELEGSLQLARGRPGIVRVAGRVPEGFAASGLSRDNRLTLSAMGAGPVQYLVTVPEGVWVNIRFPDRHRSESVGGHARTRSFDWSATASGREDARGNGARPDDTRPDEPPARRVPPHQQRPDGASLRGDRGAAMAGRSIIGAADGLLTAVSQDLAPASISFPRGAAVGKVTVRTGSDRFRIATSRPLALESGDPRFFEIRPIGDPMDIAIDLPVGTADFNLFLGDATALTVRDGTPSAVCTPVTQQWLSGGRRWFTFTPMAGRFQCESDQPVRHKG